MANSFDLEDDDDDLYGAPTDDNLRSHARKIEKQNKALLKQLEEFQAEKRTSTLSKIIETKGLNPLVAGLIPTEVKSAEEISGWLDTYGSLFGAPTPPPAAPSKPDPSGAGAGQGGPNGTATNVDPAVLLEMERQSNADAGGTSQDISAVEAALANTTSQDDVKAILLQYGGMRG